LNTGRTHPRAKFRRRTSRRFRGDSKQTLWPFSIIYYIDVVFMSCQEMMHNAHSLNAAYSAKWNKIAEIIVRTDPIEDDDMISKDNWVS